MARIAKSCMDSLLYILSQIVGLFYPISQMYPMLCYLRLRTQQMRANLRDPVHVQVKSSSIRVVLWNVCSALSICLLYVFIVGPKLKIVRNICGRICWTNLLIFRALRFAAVVWLKPVQLPFLANSRDGLKSTMDSLDLIAKWLFWPSVNEIDLK